MTEQRYRTKTRFLVFPKTISTFKKWWVKATWEEVLCHEGYMTQHWAATRWLTPIKKMSAERVLDLVASRNIKSGVQNAVPTKAVALEAMEVYAKQFKKKK